ncbi:MAG: Flavoprotein, HI0933 family [Parcubacteria group bacterium GW2011_GWF2_38_76]|nr:MAG: Flavoprotein, HI0933 family [Parcubacteria group bacterium GW2011_GWF2_38_76]HBM45980.1 aminoacetone oxidase family FAD-binding enzyme [Patescibacteria group bacterium]
MSKIEQASRFNGQLRDTILLNRIWDVIVIGGGPAGMTAAGRAAERGRSVLLLEKNPTLGKKLLISGGGRCNFTNNKNDLRTMLSKYKESDKFLFSAFSQFGVADTIKFFNDRGMETKEEEGGRMFPISDNSKSVLNVLVKYMKKGDVNVLNNAEVAGISINKSTEQVIITFADKSEVRAKSCVVAFGGTSHPETGSTGEGFKWLKKLGHKIIEDDASLVPIALKDTWVKDLAGIALDNIKLTSFRDNVKQKAYKGKLLFTHVGISGPTVLNMSREVGELLPGAKNVVLMLDLFPTEDSGAIMKKLQAILIGQSNKKIKNTLSSLVPSGLVEPLLMIAEIDGETPNHSVRSEQRKSLVSLFKSIPLHVAGLLGKEKAIVSSGGVSLEQVNFKTMQSRIVPQIYLVGDVLNIDRPSGGYSLQLCWTTGYVAGNNC